MNLSEVHSLSPAFPDVGVRVVRAATWGGKTNFASSQTNQKKHDKLNPRGG